MKLFPGVSGAEPLRLNRWIAARAGWLLPALIAVVGFVPAAWALYAQSFAVLGRDQGIFQYVAWALRHGERAYRDIHEINGPLPHAWHLVMQLLGGEDEHVFRTIDTVYLTAAYAFAATTIPRWVDLDLGGPAARRRGLVAWLLAGVAVLGPQYARYDWWHTSQREALYAILILTSLSLQSIGHTTRVRRRALVAFALAGVTTTLPWFGKPPCAVFALLQAFVLMLDRRDLAVSLRAAVASAMAGGIAVLAAMLSFIAVYGDLGRGVALLSKVPRLHHTIWNETLLGAYRAYNNAPRLDWAAATLAIFLVVYWFVRLPPRALLAAVLPVGGFIVFAGQGKAFPYHLHMLTLGTAVGQLVIVASLAKATASARIPAPVPIVLAALALGLGAKAAEDALLSPGVRGRWPAIAATPEMRGRRVAEVVLGEVPPREAVEVRAAAWLAFHTRPDDRVQIYGFDPYLLFLARRKSASPVIYDFELNVDAALEGGPGARPTDELRAWLLAYRDEAEALVLEHVVASPPAAFALIDNAPFTHPEDAEADFAAHCPKLDAFMRERYDAAAAFGTVHIWLRRDLTSTATP